MKKTLILTESELIKVVNRIVESYSDDTYDDEDYVEVFLQYFRPWIRANHGDEVGEYPLSFLVKKYIAEFAEANGMYPDQVIYGYRNNLANASNVGKRLVKMGKHKLPSLRSQEKFTDRYKKPLEFFVAQLGLPEFIKLNFIETTPFNVGVEFLINWEGLIKYQGEGTFHTDRIKKEIRDKIQGFLGVEFGNPVHGQLKLDFGRPQYVGVDEWVKKTLNKQIKKEIRGLPRASYMLHAIKFETNNSSIGGELKFSFKSWNGRNEFMRSAKELLQQMGYNINILKVVH